MTFDEAVQLFAKLHPEYGSDPQGRCGQASASFVRFCTEAEVDGVALIEIPRCVDIPTAACYGRHRITIARPILPYTIQGPFMGHCIVGGPSGQLVDFTAKQFDRSLDFPLVLTD